MGNFDAKFGAYERAIKKDPAWQNMSKAERAEQMGRYADGLQQAEIKAARKAEGRAYARMLAEEKASVFGKGTPNVPAVITNPVSGTPNLPAVIPAVPQNTTDVIKTSTKNEGFKVAKKWSSKDGKRCYLADRNGNFYLVDKSTYNAAKTGKSIKPITSQQVKFNDAVII